MKFQPRRFVVEVKRGTSRTAFTSPDTLAQKFSSAEEMLFGGGAKSGAPQPSPVKAKPASPNGRILESLIEPPPPLPVVEELSERPRRGRKPGSKNKPKVQATSPAPVAPAGMPLPRPIEAIPAERRAFDEDGLDWRDHDASMPADAEAHGADRHPAREQGGERPTATGRTTSRLRDRSSIIKRYVLGTEPRPGQPGSLRALIDRPFAVL